MKAVCCVLLLGFLCLEATGQEETHKWRCSWEADLGSTFVCFDIPGYVYNTSTGACAKLKYGRCNGKWDEFSTLEECQATCAS
ncbi:hypothetical protein BsWGS_23809 [Bradybaena similaris]